MMMQMLEAGGVPLLVDEARPADRSNPRGYFELAAVKAIARDDAFLDRARGRGIKIVSPLLRSLPARHRYRVILMERPLDQVLRSQATLLGDASAPENRDASSAALRAAFEKVVSSVDDWLASSPNVELLRVSHAEAIRSAEAVARRVAGFVGERTDQQIAAMTRSVDPKLHREQSS